MASSRGYSELWLINLSCRSSRSRLRRERKREFLTLSGQMQGLVRRKGYGTNQLLRDGEHPRRYYDIRIWRNAEAAAQAESDREIDELRRSLGEHLQSTPLVDVAWAVEVGLAAAGPVAGAARLRRTGGPRPIGACRTSRLSDRIAAWASIGGSVRVGPAIRCHPTSSRRRSSRGIGRARSFRISKWARRSRRPADGSSPAATSRTRPTASRCARSVSRYSRPSPTDTSRSGVSRSSRTPRSRRRPCGACRQILWELAGNLEVILADLHEIKSRHQLKDLLPHPFDARFIE